MTNDEILEIKCPRCGKIHLYGLSVERSLVFGTPLSSSPPTNPNIVEHKFTRLFTCPEKNEEFQATIKLKETGSDRIDSVRVKGVVKRKGTQG